MQYTKYLRWGIIGGLFLALFVPFIVATGGLFPNMFFPYITGKNFAFRIIVEIIFGLYLILAIRDVNYRPKGSLVWWSALGLLAWVGVAIILSVDPVKSFWGNFERMDGYIDLLHLVLYFVVAGAVLTQSRLWHTFFQTSVSVSLLQGLIAVSQVFHFFGLSPSSQSGVRADGTFGNATYLAVYMLFNFFIALYLLANMAKKKGGIKDSWPLAAFYGLALVLSFLSLFFTETRGAMLGLLGGLLVAALYIAIFARSREQLIIRRVSFGVLASIVVLVGAFFVLKDTPVVQNSSALSRLASISLEDRTTISRFMIWNMALEGAKEKPIFGWGQENFSYVFNKYYNPAMWSQEQWFDRAHNEFLDWLIAGGIPAFLFYVALFALAAWAIFRSKTLTVPEQAALLGLLAGYAFNNMFVFDNLVSFMYFFGLLAFVHGLSENKLPGWMLLSRPGNDRVVAIAAPVVLVLIVGGGWLLNAPGLARATTLINALQQQNPATGAQYTTAERLSAFKRVLADGELGRQETVEQLFQYVSNSVAPSAAESPQAKQEAYEVAEQAGLALLAQRKNDARLELFMGVFYSQFGQFDKALAQFNQALENSPQKQQILFQTGVTYLQQGNTAQALTLFKKAFELDEEYPDARVMYATGLYYSGQSAEADKLLTDGFGTVNYDDERLLQTYMSLKMYDRVVAVWNARVAAAPTDTNVLLGLASVYFQMGNTTQTIETLKKIEQIDPSAAPQMEQIIKQIQDGTLKAQ